MKKTDEDLKLDILSDIDALIMDLPVSESVTVQILKA